MAKFLKLSFVLPHADLSGGIRVVATYAEKLQNRGHEVVIVSQPRAAPSFFEKAKALLRGKWLRAIGSSASHFDTVDVHHIVLESARPVVDADLPDADIVLATWWETAEWVSRLSEAKGKKVYFVQGHEVFAPLPAERSAATYRLPLHKIAVSTWLKNVMRDEYGETNVSVVPNAVDHRKFAVEVREKREILTIGFVFSTNAVKNTRLAIDVCMKAKLAYPELRVICFGGEEPDGDLALPGWVDFRFQPPQSDIPQIYADCDAWLFTSEAEGFGLPILEAMACRTPVLATLAGAAPDLIADGVNGYLVDSNVAAFMAKIHLLVSMSSKEWRDLSLAAFETASGYTWEASVSKLEDELVALVESASS